MAPSIGPEIVFIRSGRVERDGGDVVGDLVADLVARSGSVWRSSRRERTGTLDRRRHAPDGAAVGAVVDSTSHTVIAHSAVAPATWRPTSSARHVVEVLDVADRRLQQGDEDPRRQRPLQRPAARRRPALHPDGEGDGEADGDASPRRRGPGPRRRCRRRSAGRPRRRRAVRRRSRRCRRRSPRRSPRRAPTRAGGSSPTTTGAAARRRARRPGARARRRWRRAPSTAACGPARPAGGGRRAP